MSTAANKPAPTPTALNVWVLAKLFGGETTVPNRVDAVDAPHIRRCLKAGLVAANGRETLSLTPAGIAVIAASR